MLEYVNVTFWYSVSPKYAIAAKLRLALANITRSRSCVGIAVLL